MSHERRRLIYSAVSFAVTSTISARSGVSLYAVVMDEMAAASGGFFLPSVCFYLFESLGVSPAVHVVLTCAVTTLAFSKPFSTGKRRDGMSRAGGVRVGERSPHNGDTERFGSSGVRKWPCDGVQVVLTV